MRLPPVVRELLLPALALVGMCVGMFAAGWYTREFTPRYQYLHRGSVLWRVDRHSGRAWLATPSERGGLRWSAVSEPQFDLSQPFETLKP